MCPHGGGSPAVWRASAWALEPYPATVSDGEIPSCPAAASVGPSPPTPGPWPLPCGASVACSSASGRPAGRAATPGLPDPAKLLLPRWATDVSTGDGDRATCTLRFPDIASQEFCHVGGPDLYIAVWPSRPFPSCMCCQHSPSPGQRVHMLYTAAGHPMPQLPLQQPTQLASSPGPPRLCP